MSGPIRKKLGLWTDIGKGATARMSSRFNKPVIKRDDISEVITNTKIDRANNLQKLRLKYYPSIDVDYDKLYAGKIEAELDEAEEMLERMGYRNNPTAYVEVTDEYGPDDGSYSRQFVTELGVGDGLIEEKTDLPALGGFPQLYKRIKRQIHVTTYRVNDEVHFLAHEEISAWLQPMRHVIITDSDANIGVRDFRDDWKDMFGSELPR